MSVAEVILRIASGLVGWLLLYSHGLLVAVVPVADCSPQLWSTTLGFAGMAGVGVLVIGAMTPWRDTVRWLSLPAFALIALGSWAVLPLLVSVTWDGIAPCAALAGDLLPRAEAWERAWAPLQITVLLAGAARGLLFWRAPRGSGSE